VTPTAPPRPPSLRWYKAAAWVVAAGLALGLGWFVHAITVQTHAVNDTFVEVPWRPGASVEVTEPGVHTVWTGPACNGACRPLQDTTYRRHLTVGFRSEDGRTASVAAAERQYFNVGGGREGRAVWLVDLDRPGTWTAELGTDGEVPRPLLWVSPGEGLPIRAMRGSYWLAGTAAAIAAVMVAGTRLLRRRAYDRMPPVQLSGGRAPSPHR
jgi:hypothetical protein